MAAGEEDGLELVGHAGAPIGLGGRGYDLAHAIYGEDAIFFARSQHKRAGGQVGHPGVGVGKAQEAGTWPCCG